MHVLKRYMSLLVLLSVTALAAPAMAQPQSQSVQEKTAFARDFAQKVLAILQDPKESFGDRKDVLRRAFSDSVDIDWIARFVLGKAWDGATDDQRARYTALYRKYLTETYVSSFAENPDKRIRDIRIDGVSEQNDEDFTVHTQMELADSEDLDVNYMVRQERNGYKVIDIAIEHVSLIATHRAEFSSLAADHGIEGVIAALQQHLDGAAPMTLSMK